MAGPHSRLTHTLPVAVNGLDRLDENPTAIEKWGVRHEKHAVSEGHSGTVGEAPLWALRLGLGPGFTSEVRDVGASVCGQPSGIIVGAAEEAHFEAPEPAL